MTREDKYQEYTDHDLLIQLNVKLDLIDKQFTNHLQHHWSITLMAISTAFMGLASFTVGLLMLLFKT